MKKILFIAILCIVSLGLSAQERNLTKMTLKMEKLWKAGDYLEAMDTATLVLTLDGDNHAAKEFVHRNWDKMQQRAERDIERLNDPNDLDEAAARCEIYRLLDEIHGNLSVIKLPLVGYHQSWVWQPEVSYYSGHYDNERMKTYRLLMSFVRQSLADRDTESAGQFVNMAMDKYLLTEGERKKCRKDMVVLCTEELKKVDGSDKVYDAIYAYDLSVLSLKMDSTQSQIREQQPILQQHVSDLYLQEANLELSKGDSIRANELFLSAEEWKVNKD